MPETHETHEVQTAPAAQEARKPEEPRTDREKKDGTQEETKVTSEKLIEAEKPSVAPVKRVSPQRKPIELNMYLIEHTFFPYSPNSDMLPANSQPIIPILSLTPVNEGSRQGEGPSQFFPSSSMLQTGSPFVMPSAYMRLASTPTLLSSFSNALKGQPEQGTLN